MLDTHTQISRAEFVILTSDTQKNEIGVVLDGGITEVNPGWAHVLDGL